MKKYLIQKINPPTNDYEFSSIDKRNDVYEIWWKLKEKEKKGSP